MPLTRLQLVTRAREQANAVGSTKDWPADLVLLYADAVLAVEYDAILFAAPYWRTGSRVVALDSTRRLALTAFDSGSGATQQVTHRVLQLALGSVAAGDTPRRLVYADPWQIDLTQSTKPSGYWTLDNDEVVVGGSPDAAGYVTALVAYRPPLATSLADGDTVTLPAGYELVAVLMLAAEMLGKAGRDTQQALELEARAEAKRAPLLAQLSTRFGGARQLGGDVSDDYPGFGAG